MVNKIVKSSLFIPLFLLIVAPALAVGRPDFANRQVSPTASQTGKARSCQAIGNSVKTRMTNLTRLATTMEEKFGSIAQRVEDYYTTKAAPKGKTVANYDALVADITAKKTAVTESISTAQTDVNAFSCDSFDPKSQVTTFRVNMQTVMKSLKEYRTSIKNLIVAVRSVTGEENKTSPEPIK